MVEALLTPVESDGVRRLVLLPRTSGLELPGHLERGESVSAAAVREAYEELGHPGGRFRPRLESALVEHEACAEAAVVGVPSDHMVNPIPGKRLAADRVRVARRDVDGSWRPRRRLHPPNDVPDIQPSVLATTTGALVAWNVLDGEDYRVVVARPGAGAPNWSCTPTASSRIPSCVRRSRNAMGATAPRRRSGAGP